MGDILFTQRELDVMSILWRRGSGTVAEVRAELEEDLAYTTVLSALQVLTEKGFVRHEPEGRAYRYYATVAPDAAGDSALGRILDKIFQGSEEQLLTRLVNRRDMQPGELARLRRLLDERLEEEGS
ncbi:MAG TPA: BlaI/MecI/CopY family transcriptional regulator [Longimicrobiales bacterium]|nr:BlaI/MecI/CopY family transcriptional regulator [Longimicrobiales bacterium]